MNDKLIKKIEFLENSAKSEVFRPYQLKVIDGLKRAINEEREYSQNSVLMIERMWKNRNE